MRLSTPMKLTSVLIGLVVALAAASALYLAALGEFDRGREAAVLAGVFFSVLSASLLSLPFWPRVAKALGMLALIYLAAFMLIAVFTPGLAAKEPAIYQVAAISLVVLLLARFASSVRRSRARQDT